SWNLSSQNAVYPLPVPTNAPKMVSGSELLALWRRILARSQLLEQITRGNLVDLAIRLLMVDLNAQRLNLLLGFVQVGLDLRVQPRVGNGNRRLVGKSSQERYQFLREDPALHPVVGIQRANNLVPYRQGNTHNGAQHVARYAFHVLEAF